MYLSVSTSTDGLFEALYKHPSVAELETHTHTLCKRAFSLYALQVLWPVSHLTIAYTSFTTRTNTKQTHVQPAGESLTNPEHSGRINWRVHSTDLLT